VLRRQVPLQQEQQLLERPQVQRLLASQAWLPALVQPFA
jgi:hypothetical protein